MSVDENEPLDKAQLATLDQTTLSSFFDWVAEGKTQKSFVEQYNTSRPSGIAAMTLGRIRRMIMEGGAETFDYYQIAKAFHADSLVDEMLPIADDVNSLLDVAVANVKISTRKWIAEKYNNKSYGAKVEQQHSLAPGSAPLSQIIVQAVPPGHFLKSDDPSVED